MRSVDRENKFYRRIILAILLVWSISLWGGKQTLSPLTYGLKDCISDIQRYYVLQEVHDATLKQGCVVE